MLPEDFGKDVGVKMLNTLMYESSIDESIQSNILLLIACSNSKEFSRVKLGRITSNGIEMMRLIDKFFNLRF